MAPGVYDMLERIEDAANDLKTAVRAVREGKHPPTHAANRCIGLAAFIDALAHEIKEEEDKARS